MKKILSILLVLISFTSQAQVSLGGYIQPLNASEYPVQLDSLGKGGYRVVNNTTERDAITCLRRKYGMAVYCIADQTLYILKDSNCNNIWEAFTTSTSSNQTRLVSGSAVWTSGLNYNVTSCSYYILGNFYTSQATTVTLSAADPTNPRIDVIYLDTLGNVGVLTGNPSPDPIKPIVNPISQIELSHIYLSANSTSPPGVYNRLIYNENSGAPTEWNTGTISPSNVNFNYTINPYIGSRSLYFSENAQGDAAYFDYSPSYISADTINYITMYVRINSAAELGKGIFFINLQKDGNTVTNDVIISDGTFGFSQNVINEYQLVSIPISAFTFSNPSDLLFNKITLINVATFVPNGTQVDYINLQSGGAAPPVTNNFWSLSGNDISTVTSPKLGTTSNNSLSIVTNDIERINISDTGLVKITNLQTNVSQDTATNKPVGVNSNGELIRMNDWATGTIYAENPIMATVRNDSNIIYFNADTAAAWRGGGATPNLQQVTDVGNTTTNELVVTDGSNTSLINPSGILHYSTTVGQEQFISMGMGGLSINSQYYVNPTLTEYYDTQIQYLQQPTGHSTYDRGITLYPIYPTDTFHYCYFPQTVPTQITDTIATLRDIRVGGGGTTPNLEQVLTAGNTSLTNTSIVLGVNSSNDANATYSYNGFSFYDDRTTGNNGGFLHDSIFLIHGSFDVENERIMNLNTSYLKWSKFNVDSLAIFSTTYNPIISTENHTCYLPQLVPTQLTDTIATLRDVRAGGAYTPPTYTATIVPYADGSGNLTGNTIDMSYSSNTLRLGNGAVIGTQYALDLDNNRATLYGNFNGMRLNVGSGTTGTVDASKGFSFYNKGTRYAYMGSSGTGGVGNHWFKLDSADLYLPRIAGASDSMAVIEATTGKIKAAAIPIGGGGTVTNIYQGYGISNSTNPITTIGTISVDSATLSGKYLRIADTSNLVATKSNVALKLNISDTSNMLSPYARTNVVNAALANKLNISDTSNMLSPYARTNAVAATYVPYTGATADVDLGTHIMNAQSLAAKGTNGAGHIDLRHQASDAPSTGQTTAIFADANGDFKWKNATNYYTTLKTSTNTADRTYTFQDKSYILADNADLANKLNTSDTASMLANYGRKNYNTLSVVLNNGNTATDKLLQLTASTTQAGYMTTKTSSARGSLFNNRLIIEDLSGNSNYTYLDIDTATKDPYLMIHQNSSSKECRIYSNNIDFKNLSNGSIVTINAPNSSSNRTINFQDKSYTIADSADVTLKANLSQGTYSFLANNTNASANMASTPFKDVNASYTGTPTWTGGTAPTTLTNATYQYTQIGKQVTLRIYFQYTNAGTLNTRVQIPFISDFPTPITPSGLTSTTDILYYGNGLFGNNKTNYTSAIGSVVVFLRGTATPGYEIVIDRGAAAAQYVWVTIQYFTNTTY